MKTLVFFAGLLAFAFTLQLPILQQQQQLNWGLKNQLLNENVGQDLLTKQTAVLKLFKNIIQPSSVPEIESIGLSYDIQANVQMYKNPQLVEDFFLLYSTYSLPQGQIFSIFNEEQIKEAIAFTRLLMSAVDFDTFYKTAAWGRMFLNETLYVYSLSVALVHRPDTYYIQLPPIYEIYPWYFYNVDVWQQIQEKTGIPVIKPGVSGLQGLIKYLQGLTQSQQSQWQQQQTLPFVSSLQGLNQYLQGLIQKVPLTQQTSEIPTVGTSGLQGLSQYLQQTLPQLQQNVGTINPEIFTLIQGLPQWQQQQIIGLIQKVPLTELIQYLQGLIQSQQMLPQQNPDVIFGLQKLIQQLQSQQGQWQPQQSWGTPVVSPLQGLNQYLQGLIQKVPSTQQTSEIPIGLQGLSQYLQGVIQGQQVLPQLQQIPIQSQQGWLPYQQVPFQYQQVPFQYQQSWPQLQQIPFQSQQIPWQFQSQQSIPTISRLLKLLTPPQTNTPIVPKYFQQSGTFPTMSSPQQQLPIRQTPLWQTSPEGIGRVGRVTLEKSIPSMQYLNKWIRKVMVTSPEISQMTPGNVYTTQEREKVPLGQQQVGGIVVYANYTLPNPMQNPETLMSYFTEDVALNALQFYYNVYFPSWMSNDEIIFNTQKRGEQFYYMIQQLLARYNLERISNGLPALPLLDFQSIVPVGYQSTLSYLNGVPFPSRPDNVPIMPLVTQQVYDNSSMRLMNLRLFESRLLDAIDSGFVLTRDGRLVSLFEPQGFEILGDIIQANPQSPNVRYYGDILTILRNILGNANIPINQYVNAPSAIQHFGTALRDPAFYQLYTKIVSYFQRYKQYLPMYTQQQLLLPGVQIQDVKVDKLVTYLEPFITDVTSSLTSPIESVPIQIQQTRLTHQPFNYYLNVMSEQPYEAVVRVFLGPKNDITGTRLDIIKNRLNFVELDQFKYTLVPGINTIQRSSLQFGQRVPETSTPKELFMQLVNPLSTPIVSSINWSIPQRLLLPRGTPAGVPYQMFFIITQAQPVQTFTTRKLQLQLQQPILPWDVQLDQFPYGFPLDRPIDARILSVPNSFVQDVVVYSEINPMFENIEPFVRMQMPMQF